MPFDVVLLVLLGAALHATWNALVKSGSDKQLDSIMIALGASVVALCGVAFVPLPHIGAWPYVLGSVMIHFTYFQLVGTAYKLGDIGLVYPLMRGAAPLIVATTSGAILGETLSPLMFAGVVFISAGVLTIAADFRGGNGKAIGVALANREGLLILARMMGQERGTAMAYILLSLTSSVGFLVMLFMTIGVGR